MRIRRDLPGAVMVVAAAVLAGALVAGPAVAGHWRDFVHDHSSSGVPYRPEGLSGLIDRFGEHCSDRANDTRTWFPSAVDRNVGGYVYYHTYLARNVGWNLRGHVSSTHQNGALDYGIYGYACRLKRGGTSWSVHSWGAAIDTNTARNPFGQTYWNGRGADGDDHGDYLPDIYKGGAPGHRFYWGLNFSGTKDPMHFQYVTGY
jgi:D-alanyl-D-alanine carboxypeptidase-like protein